MNALQKLSLALVCLLPLTAYAAKPSTNRFKKPALLSKIFGKQNNSRPQTKAGYNINDHIREKGMPQIEFMPELPLPDGTVMRNQQTLFLFNANITSLDGLQNIRDIQKVTAFTVKSNALNGSTIRAIPGMPNLEVLSLAYNGIGGINADVFRNFKKLKWLNLSGNRLTQNNINEIKRVLPNTTILTNLPE